MLNVGCSGKATMRLTDEPGRISARQIVVLCVLLVLLVTPFVWQQRQRKPEIPGEDASSLWPRYNRAVRMGLSGPMWQAFNTKGGREGRMKVLRLLPRQAWQLVGGPEPDQEDREHLTEVFSAGAEGMCMLGGWAAANRVDGGTDPERCPARCRKYVEDCRDADAWVEELAEQSEAPMLKLLEAIVPENDRVIRWKLEQIQRTAQSKMMEPHYDRDLEPWEQPDGLGDMLREMVLLYIVVSRPDRHLAEYLGELSDRFGVKFSLTDVVCALARAGKVEMANRLLPEAVKSRPSKAEHFAPFRRVALCFLQNPNKDTAAAVAVLDDMVARSSGAGSALAFATAGEWYEEIGEHARAVANYRKAYEEEAHEPAGFGAALKAADLEAFKLDSPESAAEAMEEAIANAPGDRWADAQLLLLRIYAKLKRSADMAEVCKKLAIDDSESDTGAATLLAAGSELHKAGANDQALTLLNEHLPLFDEHGKGAQARLLNALVFLNRWENAKAREQLKAVLALDPAEDLAARAQFLMGYSHLVVQEYADAKRELDSLCARYPQTRWAKTAEKQYLPGLRRFAAKETDGNTGDGDR